MIQRKKPNERKVATNSRIKRERRKLRSAKGTYPARDPKYLAWIRTLPCVCCDPPGVLAELFPGRGIPDQYPTEVAHVGDRGLGQKCSDLQTIPLCAYHHRTGPESHHRLGNRFWSKWGINKEELIANLNQRYQQESGRAE